MTHADPEPPAYPDDIENCHIILRPSEKFNAPDSDVVLFRSSDHMSFRIHRKHLEVHSPLLLEICTIDDPHAYNTLAAESSVLELFFQYFYPMKLPNLDDIDHSRLFALAVLVEEYKVYAAMALVHAYMRRAVSDYPLHVLRYAAGNIEYAALAEEAARLSLGEPLEKAVEVLTPRFYIPWTIYVSHHRQLYEASIPLFDKTTYDHHEEWKNHIGSTCPYAFVVLVECLKSLSSSANWAKIYEPGWLWSVANAEATPPQPDTKGCRIAVSWWIDEVEELKKQLPSFMSLMSCKVASQWVGYLERRLGAV